MRCVYHGWKFDRTGTCVDMPSEPAESTFKAKVRARAYPCVERNDVVWAYMGPRPTPPPLPDLEPNMLARGEYAVQKVLRECNWFQGLEGDIDTGHLSFLHLGAVKPEDTKPGSFDYYNVTDRAPRYEVVDTPFGTSYGAYRPAEPDTYYASRTSCSVHTMILPASSACRSSCAWVPVDDEHVMFWSMECRSREGRGWRRVDDGGVVVAAAGTATAA